MLRQIAQKCKVYVIKGWWKLANIPDKAKIEDQNIAIGICVKKRYYQLHYLEDIFPANGWHCAEPLSDLPAPPPARWPGSPVGVDGVHVNLRRAGGEKWLTCWIHRLELEKAFQAGPQQKLVLSLRLWNICGLCWWHVTFRNLERERKSKIF